jgi:hypothetical protein
VLLVDPVASRTAELLDRRTPTITRHLPALDALMIVITLGAFLTGERIVVFAGTLFFQLGFLLERTVVHSLGRREGRGAELVYLNRLPLCAFALFVGRYQHSHSERCLLLGLVCVAAALLGQVTGGRRPGPPRVGLLSRRGLRTRPFSEVELAMAVCVVAPETGFYTPVVIVAVGLLLLCEAAGVPALLRTPVSQP